MLAAMLAGACGCEGEELERQPSAKLIAFLAAADPAPARTAFLVGIDRYAPEREHLFADLGGCGNDVRLMREVLVEEFRFEERDVFVLLDEEATHEGIVDAFDRVLIQRAREGTEVFFYLSGHGSRVPDLSRVARAEHDRRDSTFLAYDSRTDGHDGDRDLNDDELRCLLTALAKKGASVTAVTDSCHSGGGLRNGPQARSVSDGASPLDRDWVRSFWPEGVELSEDAVERHVPVDSYVHIAAAERDQRAWEYQCKDLEGNSVTHGALTYVLAGALRNAPGTATWRTIIDDVAIQVANLQPQTVNARGTVDRLLFGNDVEGPGGFKAEWKHDKSSLLIHAGWLHGLREGSVLEVRDASGLTVLGTARVEKYNAARALAAWEGEAPEGSLEGGLRVHDRSRPAGEPPLRVLLEEPIAEQPGQVPEDLVDYLRVRKALHEEPLAGLIELVEGEELADYRLHRDPGGTIRLGTIEGLPLVTIDESSAGDGPTSDPVFVLENAVRQELRWRAVNLLASERGAIPIEVGVRPASLEEIRGLTRKDCERVEFVEGGLRVRGAPSGAPVQVGVLEITHSHEKPVHLYVLSIEESRAVHLIHPIGGEDDPIAPGKLLEAKVGFIAPSSWPFARPMRDRYLVLAVEHPIDLGELEMERTLRGTSPPDRALPPMLRRAIRGRLTRGGESTDVVPDGWGAAVLDILVMQPE